MPKTILILGAGLEQCVAIRKAQNLGYMVVACDENSRAPGLALADIGFCVDIKNISKLIAIAKSIKADGVFSHAVEIPEVVSRISEHIGTPCLSSKVAATCTDKSLRIEKLKEFGIPVAEYVTASNSKQLITVAENFGFPLVLKPVDNAGSRGVKLVNDIESLLIAYREAIFYSEKSLVLIERYLKGPQISTESVIYKGGIHTFGFADRNYVEPNFFEPYFIEDGINFPSILPFDLQKKILVLVEKAINVLGINFGAAKGDIIVHNGIPHIIEMASRTSGGWFGAGSIPFATGVDPLKPLLQMSVGDEPDLDALLGKWRLGCAQRYWIPRENGILNSISGIDVARNSLGVQMFDTFFPDIGSKFSKAQNHSQRYAQVICTGETREEAMQRADSAIKSINVEIIKSPNE